MFQASDVLLWPEILAIVVHSLNPLDHSIDQNCYCKTHGVSLDQPMDLTKDIVVGVELSRFSCSDLAPGCSHWQIRDLPQFRHLRYTSLERGARRHAETCCSTKPGEVFQELTGWSWYVMVVYGSILMYSLDIFGLDCGGVASETRFVNRN